MGKFCTSCGSEVLPEQSNCTNCGASISGATNSSKASTIGGDKSKYIGIGVVVIVGIILISIISSLLSPGYKKPLDYIVKGMNKSSAKTLIKAFPKQYRSLFEMSIDDDMLEEQLDSVEDEYGKNVKYSYKIVDKEKIKKDDLKDAGSLLTLGSKSMKITKGYNLTVEFTTKGKDKKETNEAEIQVYKIDGDWCIMDMPL